MEAFKKGVKINVLGLNQTRCINILVGATLMSNQ